MKLRAWLLSLGLIAFVSGPLFSVQPAQAQEKSWKFLRWESNMAVQENGDIKVRETQTVQFNGSFSFFGRTIPLGRVDDITDIRVVDETAKQDLTPADYDLTSTYFEGQPAVDVEINFALTNAIQTWSIYYTVEGGVGFFEDHDEVYWNVISSDRDVPIDAIDTVVQLPKAVDPAQIKTTFYEDGVDTVTQDVIDGRTVRFTTGRAAPGTNFTIVVGWPTGIVKNPGIVRVESKADNANILVDGQDSFLEVPAGLRRGKELLGPGPYAIQIQKYGITSEPTLVDVQPGETKAVQLSVFDTFAKKFLVAAVVGAVSSYALMPVWVAIILYFRWRKTGRDPKGRGTIIAEYDPPEDLTPGVVGTLFDEEADLKDLSATIIDLAVRGYLVIQELGQSKYLKNYKFILKKSNYSSDSTLLPYEKQLLDKLFDGKEENTLDTLRYKFYQYVKPIQDKMYEEVMRREYFDESPDKRRAKYSGWAGILSVIGFFGFFWYGLGVPIFITGIVVGIFGRAAPRRTQKGVLANEHAKGFKLYLYTAERYVVKKMTPETFERFLPYAMVFGVERQWAQKFVRIYDQQPDWYRGVTPGQTFTAFALTDALRGLSTATTSTLVSRPGSSGHGGGFSSGSSGFSGGFSGGGGGGGGSRAG
ncbi:MAG: DUF2207 domain-containing protein [Candidatus Andersenbacteria bacterium]